MSKCIPDPSAPEHSHKNGQLLEVGCVLIPAPHLWSWRIISKALCKAAHPTRLTSSRRSHSRAESIEPKPQMAPGSPGPGAARALRQVWLWTWAVHSRYEGRRVCSRSLAVSAFTESRLSSSSSSSSSSPTAWNFSGPRDMVNLGGVTEQGCSSGVREGLAILPRERWQKLRVREGCQGVSDSKCSGWGGEAKYVRVNEEMGVGDSVQGLGFSWMANPGAT